jgi:hypothetical protein
MSGADMNRKSAVFYIVIAIALAGLAALELADIRFSADEQFSRMIKSILTRGIGGIIALIFLCRLGYGRLLSPTGKPFRCF